MIPEDIKMDNCKMKVYLVGGAVRDTLLGLPVKERDWVVVGASPEEMVKQGFKQVGKDFPVFLHPKTHEEYALARLERKTKPGYTGFTCDFGPEVTLEEDLLRRDLTINAMAMDDAGNIIDPYGGQADLQAKCLRHVSAAFVEDPVRVLRLARFQARFSTFYIAHETAQLVYTMVESGELKALVAERVWQEWEKSFDAENPAAFITALRALGALKIVLPELDRLFGVPIDTRDYPQVDLGGYALSSLSGAKDPLLLFACLTYPLGYDISQPVWPIRLHQQNMHDTVCRQLCERLKIPNRYKDLALAMLRYHQDLMQGKKLSAARVLAVLIGVGAFRQNSLLEPLLCNIPSVKKFWKTALKAALSIDMQAILGQATEGKAVQQAVEKARIQAIKEVCHEK